MPINLPREEAQTLNEGMAFGSGVKLPFETTYWFIVNGDKRMKQTGGVHYYGGWATDVDKLQEAGLTWDPPITYPPSYCYESEVVTSNGKQIPSYMTRSLIMAPIGFRTCWEIKDPANNNTKRFKDYQAGTRRHAQFLVYLADKNEQKQLVPWGPAVLSAGGMQVGKVIKAFQDWAKHINKARLVLEANAPSWVFYLALGTFGDEYKGEMVGQQGAQSSITPMIPQLPQNMTADLLEKLYVGEDVVRHMAELKKDAKDWLTAWDNLGAQQQGPKNGAPAGEFDDQFMPPPPEEDIPF